MRRLLAAALAPSVLFACASERGSEPAVDLRPLQAQLAKVARPEPAGLLDVTLAPTPGAKARISRSGQPGAWVEIRALDAADVALRGDDRSRAAHIDGVEIAHVVTGGRFEELRRVHHSLAKIELRYGVQLGPTLTRLRVVEDFVEALDADGVARLRTEPAFAVDAHGIVRALTPRLSDEGVTWSADAHDLAPPIAIDPAWTTTASLPLSRARTGAFPLPGGKKIILVDGIDSAGKTQIYDDTTASWTMGPSTSKARNVMPVQLDDGRIFLGGGASGESPTAGEILDPATLTWKLTTASPIGYGGAPVSLALSGTKILVTGGGGASVYDAGANTWVPTTGAMVTPRRFHKVARLKDGRGLLIGGMDNASAYTSGAEIYDPATGTFSAAGALPTPRLGMAVNALGDGRVIVIGGNEQTETGTVFDTVHFFDPATTTWSSGPKIASPRLAPATALMPDGKLLLAGGISYDAPLTDAHIFDPTLNRWFPAGSLSDPRGDFPIVRVGTKFLAIGGYNGAASATVDVFEAQATGKACKGAGECVSFNCVDGVCCSKAACAADESCGGGAKPGECTKKLGTPCTTGNDCGSGVCADGVCCDRACDGLCEACDSTASKGTCATLAPGESPRASHGKCPGEGPCAASCGGSDAKACTLFPGATTACGEPSCTDGAESIASTCDGIGKCTVIPKVACEPFACGDKACKRACAIDADCASGYSCDARSGRCVFGAKCDGEHTVSVPGGASIDCTPLKCAGAACLTRCATTSDCVAGTTCDTASGACVVATGGNSSDGGCAHGSTRNRPLPALLSLLLAAVAFRRSRAR